MLGGRGPGRRHGIASVVEDMVNKLRVALKSHRKTDPRCDTFGRLWGTFISAPNTCA